MTRPEFPRARDGADSARPNAGDSLHSPHDVERLVHELQVHQFELEIQNEELRSARLEAEQVREHHDELFRAAPVGYLMLDGDGVIVDCNVAAGRMMGRSKLPLLRARLDHFVADADRALGAALGDGTQPQTRRLHALRHQSHAALRRQLSSRVD